MSRGDARPTGVGVGVGVGGCLGLIGGVWAFLASSLKEALRPADPRGQVRKAKINKEELFPFEILQYIALCPLSTVAAAAAPTCSCCLRVADWRRINNTQLSGRIGRRRKRKHGGGLSPDPPSSSTAAAACLSRF